MVLRPGARGTLARVHPSAPARLSVLVVTWNCREAVSKTLAGLARQLAPGDELVVVDNASEDGTADAVARVAPDALVLRNVENVGFAPACNQAAEAARGDLLLLLNPDATPAPGLCEAIRRPLHDGRGWAAWMGLVTADGGHTINTSGGVIHFTGIAWAGESGEPVSKAPQARATFRSPPARAWRCRGRPGSSREASARTSSCTTRTSISPCACASAVGASDSSRTRASTTTTSSTRGRASGGCWSETGGRRSSARTRARCSRCSRRRCSPRSSCSCPCRLPVVGRLKRPGHMRICCGHCRASCASGGASSPRGRSPRGSSRPCSRRGCRRRISVAPRRPGLLNAALRLYWAAVRGVLRASSTRR